MPFLYKKKYVVFRKSSGPFGQVQTKMHLPDSPLSKIHFPGQTEPIKLMLIP